VPFNAGLAFVRSADSVELPQQKVLITSGEADLCLNCLTRLVHGNQWPLATWSATLHCWVVRDDVVFTHTGWQQMLVITTNSTFHLSCPLFHGGTAYS